MINKLAHVYIVVEDHDKAIEWYTEHLGMEVRANETFGPGYRWVTLGYPGQELEIILHQQNPAQPDARHALGGIAGWVLNTTDCRGDIERLRERGVKIVLEPEEQMWGVQAGFEDLYGNSFVLVQPPNMG